MKRVKSVLLGGLVAGFVFVSGGCHTPAYTPTERRQQIARNWDYEFKQATDDFDSVLLMRPASRLTIWNVR
jgi:hypothetical protein